MDAIDSLLVLLLGLVALCFVLKLGFLWEAICALFGWGRNDNDKRR